MQVVNVLVCRSERESIGRTGLGGNRLLLAGIAAELALILLAVYSPWGHALLGTAPLGVEVWLPFVPLAAAMLGLEELRKFFARRLATSSRATGTWPARERRRSLPTPRA